MRTLLAFVFGRKCDDGSERVEIVGKMSCSEERDLALVPPDKFTDRKINSTNSSYIQSKIKLALVVVMSAVSLWKAAQNLIESTSSASGGVCKFSEHVGKVRGPQRPANFSHRLSSPR